MLIKNVVKEYNYHSFLFNLLLQIQIPQFTTKKVSEYPLNSDLAKWKLYICCFSFCASLISSGTSVLILNFFYSKIYFIIFLDHWTIINDRNATDGILEGGGPHQNVTVVIVWFEVNDHYVCNRAPVYQW